MGIGNRIATVLIYLSTPEKGGFTIFNQIKTIAKPTKHDALFWYNLWRSGKGDIRTMFGFFKYLFSIYLGMQPVPFCLVINGFPILGYTKEDKNLFVLVV